jgi:hypothetical protein
MRGQSSADTLQGAGKHFASSLGLEEHISQGRLRNTGSKILEQRPGPAKCLAGGCRAFARCQEAPQREVIAQFDQRHRMAGERFQRSCQLFLGSVVVAIERGDLSQKTPRDRDVLGCLVFAGVVQQRASVCACIVQFAFCEPQLGLGGSVPDFIETPPAPALTLVQRLHIERGRGSCGLSGQQIVVD